MRNRLVVVNSAVVERLSSRCPEDIQQLSSELASLAQNHCLLINQSSLETWGAWEVCVTHAHLTHRLKWVCAEKKSIQIYFSYNLLAGNQKKKKKEKNPPKTCSIYLDWGQNQTFWLHNKWANAVNRTTHWDVQQANQTVSLVFLPCSFPLRQGAFEPECIRQDDHLSLPNLQALLRRWRQFTEWR